MRSLGLLTFLALPSLASAQDLTLTFTQLLPGNTVDYTVTNLNANETVYILRAVGTGNGACPAQIGGECLGITGPLSVLGTPVADATGTATLQILLPASVPVGTNVSFQAAAIRGLGGVDSVVSNAIGATVTGANLCPVYADPNVLPGGDGSVGNPFPSIGYALAFRDPACDEILLKPGTYDENVDYAGANVAISSTDGPGSTTLMSTVGGNLVSFVSGETSAASLSGVTVQCGNGPWDRGIEVLNSSPTLDDLVIDGCDSYGVSLSGSSALLTHSSFTANDNSGSGAGALYVNGGSPTITKNRFAGESGSSYSVHLYDTAALFANNHLENNSNSYVLYVYSDNGSVIANNTWLSNSSYSVYFAYSSSADFVNNLLYDTIGSYAVYASPSGSTPSTFENNNAFPDTYSSLVGNQTGSNGNISADPLFDASGVYVGWGSPCIDAGMNASVYGIGDDFDDNPRPLGLGYDIGAYESW
ncbi:MAG TPA: right-handed parallel beta-helix repeat-containing protein [Deltaproteobacteria bacterium]|nr:right-handed parallel beta-helix repeat-containing protein [Deltaproteobacteria bacterium]